MDFTLLLWQQCRRDNEVHSSMLVRQFLVVCLMVSVFCYKIIFKLNFLFHLKFHPGNATTILFCEVTMNSNNRYQSNDGSSFDSIFLVFTLCCDNLSSKCHQAPRLLSQNYNQRLLWASLVSCPRTPV
jgi:hypothetical protein